MSGTPARSSCTLDEVYRSQIQAGQLVIRAVTGRHTATGILCDAIAWSLTRSAATPPRLWHPVRPNCFLIREVQQALMISCYADYL